MFHFELRHSGMFLECEAIAELREIIGDFGFAHSQPRAVLAAKFSEMPGCIIQRTFERSYNFVSCRIRSSFANGPHGKHERHLLPRAPFFGKVENSRGVRPLRRTVYG